MLTDPMWISGFGFISGNILTVIGMSNFLLKVFYQQIVSLFSLSSDLAGFRQIKRKIFLLLIYKF